MTILNAWITPESALLGADTEAVAANGERAELSKLYALPHFDAVLAARGDSIFFMSVVQACYCWPESFDALCDELGNVLPKFFAQMKATAIASGGKLVVPGDAQTILLVGWSHRRGRMVGWEWTQHTIEEGFVAKEIESFIAPHDESFNLFPFAGADGTIQFSTAPAMERLVRAQVKLIMDKAPEAAGGGHLILCELKRGAVAMSRYCEL